MPGRDGESEALQGELRALLAGHGVTANEQPGGWLGLAGTGLRVKGEIVGAESVKPGMVSIQLDVRLVFEDGRVLIESFGGWGATREKAVETALAGFAFNTFHVLLTAFGLALADDQTTVETWDIGGTPRRVTCGTLLVRNTGAPPAAPGAWFGAFEDKVKAQPLPAGTHWVRVYYGQSQSNVLALEVLLDNEPWPELLAELSEVDWPKAEGFLSVRLFMVVQDVGGSTPSQGPTVRPWWRFWSR